MSHSCTRKFSIDGTAVLIVSMVTRPVSTVQSISDTRWHRSKWHNWSSIRYNDFTLTVRWSIHLILQCHNFTWKSIACIYIQHTFPVTSLVYLIRCRAPPLDHALIQQCPVHEIAKLRVVHAIRSTIIVFSSIVVLPANKAIVTENFTYSRSSDMR